CRSGASVAYNRGPQHAAERIPHTQMGGVIMLKKSMLRCGLGAALALTAWATTLAQMPNPYGLPINLATAKKVAAPALAEAAKNNWNTAVAIVDTAGNLVYYERMDNTQVGSATIAIEKARTAVMFKRPTKAFQDVLAGGGDGLRILGLRDAVPIE